MKRTKSFGITVWGWIFIIGGGCCVASMLLFSRWLYNFLEYEVEFQCFARFFFCVDVFKKIIYFIIGIGILRLKSFFKKLLIWVCLLSILEDVIRASVSLPNIWNYYVGLEQKIQFWTHLVGFGTSVIISVIIIVFFSRDSIKKQFS